MISAAEKYKTHGIAVCTTTLTVDARDKKVFGGRKWTDVTLDNMMRYVKDGHNCMLMPTGDVNGIIAIDWDLHKCERTKDLYYEILRDHGRPYTWTTITGNNGVHWIFKYDKQRFGNIGSMTNITVNGVTCSIDVRCNGGVLAVPPTKYIGLDGTKREYREDATLSIDKLSHIPQWVCNLFDFLKPNAIPTRIGKSNKKHKKTQQIVQHNEHEDDDLQNDVQPDDSASNVSLASVTSVATTTMQYDYNNELKSDIIQLMNMLHPSRCDNYQDWITIGYALHSIEGVNCFDIWNQWSQHSAKYAHGECERLWVKMRDDLGKDDVYTLGTLKYFAKQDNPTRYADRFCHSKIFKQCMECMTNESVAQCIYHFYDHNYMYDYNKEIWYELQPNNTWIASEKVPLQLYKNISKELVNKIYQYIGVLSTYAKEEQDSDKQKNYNEKIKKCLNNVKILGSYQFTDNCIKSCRPYFNMNGVSEKMNENRYILAFTDCVYDLNLCAIRPIKADDFVTITVGYTFPKRNDAVIAEVKAFLHTIFENESREEYLLKTIAGAILGHKRFEEFYIWTGKGANGKGTLYDLLSFAFGDYFKTIDISFFTKPKKNSNEVTPELVDKKGCRLLFSTEPESSELLQVAKLKEITGGDVIHARGLFKDPITFKPQFTVFLQTNDIPKLSKIDGGIQRRMRIVQFPYVFTANPTEDYHRLMDPDVKEKKVRSDAWRDAFMLILLDTYAKHIKDAKMIPLPDVVKEDTKEYLDENNPLIEWIAQRCERGALYEVKTTEAYNSFLEYSYSDISQVKFAQLMTFNGFTKRKTNATYIYVGMRLKQMTLDD